MDASQVIIRPVVSEKSYVLATADKYTFRVHPDAHKTQIRQAVEQLFAPVARQLARHAVELGEHPQRLPHGQDAEAGKRTHEPMQ